MHMEVESQITLLKGRRMKMVVYSMSSLLTINNAATNFGPEYTPRVAAGRWHRVGLEADGTVVAVRDNTYGQLNVGGWTNIAQVATEGSHTVGLKSDHTVVAVGDNTSGQRDAGDWDLD